MANIKSINKLSIIIPTLNEAKRLPLLLADINISPFEFELIVVDGGSTDLTSFIAKLGGAKFLTNDQANRGAQLHKGAMEARGEWLLFLHADCRMDKNWFSVINNVIENKLQENYAWFFDFKVKEKGIIWLALEIAVAIRSNLLKRPYGDQGLLISKGLYLKLGGFKELQIMEDLDFIIRINQKTLLKPLGLAIETSSRKYLKGNVITNSIKNAILRHKWKRGESIEKLAKSYYS